MKDAYTNAFYGIVRDTQDTHGYELPNHLEAYIVMLLAHHVERPFFEPDSSFAEKYLQLKTNRTAKELGDTCLFVSGVFPTYGRRKGLRKSYYTNIGISSYSQIQSELFSELALHFDFLSNFIELSLHSSKREMNNLFR